MLPGLNIERSDRFAEACGRIACGGEFMAYVAGETGLGYCFGCGGIVNLLGIVQLAAAWVAGCAVMGDPADSNLNRQIDASRAFASL